MEIIMRICEEAYLTRKAGLCREKYCIDMVSHPFIQDKFIEQLLGTRPGTR